VRRARGNNSSPPRPVVEAPARGARMSTTGAARVAPHGTGLSSFLPGRGVR
jgi:hypothetical protein